jgi:hypothetical protein
MPRTAGVVVRGTCYCRPPLPQVSRDNPPSHHTGNGAAALCQALVQTICFYAILRTSGGSRMSVSPSNTQGCA